MKKNKNNRTVRLLIQILFFGFIVCNAYAEDLEDRDPNKSPFPKSLYTEIEKQIYDKYSNERALEKIVDKIEKGLINDFKNIIYSIQSEFTIALMFNDLNVERYFKSLAKELYITYRREGVSLVPKIEKSKVVKKGYIVKYEKTKLQKMFWSFDSSGGLFLMFPKMGASTVQSIIMCPRQYVKRGNRHYLQNINWELRNASARTYANSNIVVNEKTPVSISAYYKFSDDAKKNSFIKKAEGNMTSAKVLYDPPVIGMFEKIGEDKLKDSTLLSMVTGVDYKKGDVEKHAYKKTSYEIKKFQLKENLSFKYSSSDCIVEKGDCYMLLSALPSFDRN